MRELIEKASQEASKGVAWAMERVVVVGRKGGDDKGVESGAEGADVIRGGNGKETGGIVESKAEEECGKKRKRDVWLKVWKRLGFGTRG